jgi:disulfide bond formation protein DsbB
MFELIKFNPRIWFFLGCVSCFAMLGIGAYLQLVENLEPCPLCISQRIAILLLGLVFLIAAIHNPAEKGISGSGRWFYFSAAYLDTAFTGE